jgi:hypothetical protein
LGGKTTDRQQLNFTGKGGFSQVGEWRLWINKYFKFSGLELLAAGLLEPYVGSLWE